MGRYRQQSKHSGINHGSELKGLSMGRFALVLVSSIMTVGMAASAQTIQVSRDNKSIYVTSEGEAKAEPEIAILTLGYHAWSKTKDALYSETATVSDKVVAALLQAGVKKEMVHTEKTSLTHVEAEANWSSDWKANRVFEADLRWKVTVPVKDAEGVVAIAMQAGATELGDVAWDVVDRTKLQAEASKNALGKARTVADSMALGLGTKLGALVYASNSAPIRPSSWPFFGTLNTSTASLSSVVGTPLPPKTIKLLPEKVSEKTTVYAVFAIE
jgi:uncharacterized protein YggE